MRIPAFSDLKCHQYGSEILYIFQCCTCYPELNCSKWIFSNVNRKLCFLVKTFVYPFKALHHRKDECHCHNTAKVQEERISNAFRNSSSILDTDLSNAKAIFRNRKRLITLRNSVHPSLRPLDFIIFRRIIKFCKCRTNGKSYLLS